jgi:hypothetical protein
MGRRRRDDKPLALIVVKRAAIFLFIICLVSLFYWIVGSESSFLDSTQSMLLTVMRLSSMGVLIASCSGILLSLGLALTRLYAFRPLGIFGYLLAALFAAAALAVAQSISFLARGLH